METTFNYQKMAASHPRMKVFSAIKREMDSQRRKPKRILGYLGLLGKFYRFLQPRGVVLTDVQGIQVFLNGGDEVIATHMMAYGVHEPQETELIRSIIKPSMTVLDVGANLGYYSLIIAKKLGNDCKIYSFEPDPHNFELLKANAEANGFSQITPIQKAVSSKAGKLNLFKDTGNLGAHSTSLQNLPTASDGLEVVDTIALDDFVYEHRLEVDLIKMDVEGHEQFVVDGASKLLGKSKLQILMEFWPIGLRSAGSKPLDLLKKMESYGFTFDVLTGTEIKRMDKVVDILQCAEEHRYVNLYLHKGL